MVLVLGLVFGGIAHMRRQARQREIFVAELARDRILANHSEPTLLCLILRKVLATDSVETQTKCSRWLGPGWFFYPKGVNAGRLKVEQVLAVIERLRQLGTVWEVEYTQPPLTEFILFYIDEVPYHQHPQGDTCIIRQHLPVGVTE